MDISDGDVNSMFDDSVHEEIEVSSDNDDLTSLLDDSNLESEMIKNNII